MRRVAVAVVIAIALTVAFGLTGPWFRPGPAVDLPGTPLARREGGASLRLVVLGTSLSHTSGWPEAIAASLGQCTGRPVELVRVTKPGANSAWGSTRIAEVVTVRPDIVLIEFAINDADMRDGLWLDTARAAHRALISGLQDARPEARVVLMTMNPATGLRGLIRPRLGAHYRNYRYLAAETGAGLVDLYPRWWGLPRSEWGLEDGLHPERAAAEAVIAPVLLPYLGVLVGANCPPSDYARTATASSG